MKTARFAVLSADEVARIHNRADMLEHMILIDGLDHIHNSQTHLWPGDIPMTTFYAEAIWGWAHRSRASFGLESPGDLIADLDQAQRGRSFKGWVGPLAYRLMR
jgi:hypothetical protein